MRWIIGGFLSLHLIVKPCVLADGEEEDEGVQLPPGQCGLYLAPSSLPFAGLGIYSGTVVPEENMLNDFIGGTYPGFENEKNPTPLWTDIAIAIADDYKALPYRGQQKHPSWLGYVWPRKKGAMSDIWENDAYPEPNPALRDVDPGLQKADGLWFFIDDDTHLEHQEYTPRLRMNAFVPGIASLANHHHELANLDRAYDVSRTDYAKQDAPWDAGAGSFTPHHSMQYVTTQDVESGMELFIDYGKDFDRHIIKRNEQLRVMQGKKKHTIKGFAEKIGRDWDILDDKMKSGCPRELSTEKAKRDRLAVGYGVDSTSKNENDTSKPYTEYRPNDYHPVDVGSEEDEEEEEKEDEETVHNSIKSLTWLNDNGICLSSGRLEIGTTTIAGTALFTTTKFAEGEVVLTTPLIALRRDDFNIYESDPNAVRERDRVDRSTIIAEELLLNYAYGHPDSSMLLVPNAPMANFINHGGKEEANVQIRWPEPLSKTGRLFEWAYTRSKEDIYDDNFESTNHNAWLRDHPIDVMEKSGKLAFEYVALRDIKDGEEIMIDYGDLWDAAWYKFQRRHPYARAGYFRHSIGVPEGFYPDNWLNVSDKYEIAELKDLENNPLEPGVALPMTYAHNGKALSPKYGYVIGLPKGLSDRFLEYSERIGVIELYRKLLTEQVGFQLESDQFTTYKTGTLTNTSTSEDMEMEFFAQKYKATQYKFDMHFVAAWNEAARKSVIDGLGDVGFDLALQGLGERFGYDRMTCFHASWMGMTHCDQAKMHSDIYATNDKSWNIIFPLITVEGTDAELNVMAEDMNVIIGVHYLKDVAYAMGDFGYHQTRPSRWGKDDLKESETAPIRVVFGAYCSQIDESNIAMIRHIYDGDDPAPFADQFTELPLKEVHWTKTGTATLRQPQGSGATCSCSESEDCS